MKIVLLTVDHVYSNKLVKDILRKFGNNVKLIIEPKVLLKNKNFFQTIIHYIKKSGFKYLYFQLLKMVTYKTLSFFKRSENSKFYSFNRIADKLKIERVKVADINSLEIVKKITRVNPDVIVSVLFPQIIKKELINLSRKRIINFHPSYLPHYRGISPIFWSILNKEKYVGYTIHHINEGIDLGGIIVQKKIKLMPTDTEDSAYQRCIDAGSNVLVETISKLDNLRLSKPDYKNNSSYFTFPDKISVNKYLNLGHKFFDLKRFIWN